jgi:hypothetical protein
VQLNVCKLEQDNLQAAGDWYLAPGAVAVQSSVVLSQPSSTQAAWQPPFVENVPPEPVTGEQPFTGSQLKVMIEGGVLQAA